MAAVSADSSGPRHFERPVAGMLQTAPPRHFERPVAGMPDPSTCTCPHILLRHIGPVCSGPRFACAGTIPYDEPRMARRPGRGQRGVGVPLGCWIRDGWRREVVSARRRHLGEPGSGFEALPFDGAVDGGAADSELVLFCGTPSVRRLLG
jgi:hypothetical protein